MKISRGALLVACVLFSAGTLTACGGAAFALVNLPAKMSQHVRTADLAYGGLPRQRLDVYQPNGLGLRPIIVFWYGGGWTRGDKDNYRFVGAALADAGYVAVLPDYRLYPEVEFPTFIEDGAAAVAWTVANAARFGGDPDRIYLAGHSAGAHTAALLALDPSYLAAANVSRSVVRGLIGLSGPYALEPTSGQLAKIFQAPYQSRDWQPVQWADQDSPPTLLLHGRDDGTVWPMHSEQLAAALQAAQVPVTLQLIDGRSHADTVAAFSSLLRWRAPTLESIVEFVAANDPQIDPSPPPVRE